MSTIPERCPVCGAPLKESGRWVGNQFVCTSCGTVIVETPFDIGPEWRSFSEEDRQRRSRVGAPLSNRRHDRGVTTYIRARRGDLRQQKLAAIQARVVTHGNQKLISILQEANRVASQLGLPGHIAETMMGLVRKLYKAGLIKKNNALLYIAASALIASRIGRHTISIRDIARETGLNQHDIWRAYSNILRKLRLKPVSVPKPHMYVSRVVSTLKLSSDVEALAYRFTELLDKTGIAQGKPPEALAAAAVYTASILLDKKRNQTVIAKAINVSDATIRNRYRDIVDNFYIEVRL